MGCLTHVHANRLLALIRLLLLLLLLLLRLGLEIRPRVLPLFGVLL